MPAYKDKATGKWYTSFYHSSHTGDRIKKIKRGFATKREALEWERQYLQKEKADLNMSFKAFVEIYYKSMKSRLKENTWLTKKAIIETKILPYFKNKKVNKIESRDVIEWQNILISYRNEKGNGYSQTYLKTIHNQLSSILNYAVKFYHLPINPAARAGSMGKSNAQEMKFWTKEEYLKFSNSMMDKPISFVAFEMLYWCGIRMGELLALTPCDFDFNKRTVRINKSYQRIKGRDVITEPKTPKSNRVIVITDF